MPPKLPRDVWPLTALILFCVFIYAPLLFFGKAFAGEEQFGFYYALSHYLAGSLHDGTSLLWNSAYYAGVPASLDQFIGAYYPVNLLLFYFLPLFAAQHISILFGTVLGLLFAYWFGRLQGWRQASSIVLALGYFSATTYAWLAIGTTAAHSFITLPALLVALWYAAHRQKYFFAVVLGGLALGVGFLAGFVQIVFYAYVVAGLYALFLDYEAFSKVRAWYRNIPVSLTYAGITALGLALGIKQFLPSAALIDLTIRTSTYAMQNVVHFNPAEVITLFLPPYFSIPFFDIGTSAGFYTGVLGLVFAILGLIYYRTHTSVFFAGMYVFVMAFAFNAPLLSFINQHLPPFSHMGGNFRWSVSAAFPLAFLVAAGVEGYLRAPERISARAKKLLLAGMALIVVALAIGSLALRYAAHIVAASPEVSNSLIAWYRHGRETLLPAEHYREVLAGGLRSFGTVFSFSNPRFFLAVALWLMALIVLWALWYYKPLRRITAHIIAGFFFINIAAVAAMHWSGFLPQSVYTKEPDLAAALTQREADQHSYRAFGFLLGDGLYARVLSKHPLNPTQLATVQNAIMINNSNLYWGIDKLDGMEPYRTLRANRLLDTVIGYGAAAYVFDDTSPALATSALDKLYNRDVQKAVSIDEKLDDLVQHLPLLSMLNVKYIYSLYAFNSPELTLLKTISIPTTDAERVQLYVYQNPRALPRVYFAANPLFTSARDTGVLLQVAHVQDFAKETIIECGSCSVQNNGENSLEIAKYQNGDVELTTAGAGGWLVFGESYIPGWHAYIDGTETPLYPANYLLQAVQVPTGEHRVTFMYRDLQW